MTAAPPLLTEADLQALGSGATAARAQFLEIADHEFGFDIDDWLQLIVLLACNRMGGADFMGFASRAAARRQEKTAASDRPALPLEAGAQ